MLLTCMTRHLSQSTSQLLCGTHVGWSLWHSSELIAKQEKSQGPAAGTRAHGALFITNHLQVSLRNDVRRCGESSKHVEKFPDHRYQSPSHVGYCASCLTVVTNVMEGIFSKLKMLWRSHPLCPRQPKSVTSDLWRQVRPLRKRPFR